MELTIELAKEMLSSGNETLKAAAIKAFPELHKSNFELACEALRIPPTIPEGLSVSMRAQYQLEKIIQVANGGWTPNFEDTNEYRYYPVFDVKTKALDCVGLYGSNSDVPAPTLFKSEELCEKAVNENLELYRQMFFGVCS